MRRSSDARGPIFEQVRKSNYNDLEMPLAEWLHGRIEGGKDYQTCWVYMEETKVRFKPRYGCGKCQLLVPCETGIPNKQYA